MDDTLEALLSEITRLPRGDGRLSAMVAKCEMAGIFSVGQLLDDEVADDETLKEAFSGIAIRKEVMKRQRERKKDALCERRRKRCPRVLRKRW